MAFEYEGVDLPIREKTISSQQMSWDMIAGPGRWWSGAQRVEIARIGRAARGHEAAESELLPESAIFAIQKLVVDNANLDRDWYEEIIAAQGMSEDLYVELVAVVVHALSIDEFHRALGLELEPLPEPRPGQPTRQRPAEAEQRGSWPPIVPRAGLNAGDEKLYGPWEWGANVISALSLIPENVRWLHDLSEGHYLSFAEMRMPDPLRAISRPQIELIAARVSAVNECFY
jgi:hypothetical protein